MPTTTTTTTPTTKTPEQSVEVQWLCSAKQASQILSISERNVRGLMANGDFELCRIGGSIRIWLDDLLRFCRENTIQIPATENQ